MIKLHQLVTGDATDKLILADAWDDMGNDGELFRCQARNALASGTVVAWGDNIYNQCDVPKGLKDVIAISVGEDFSLALTNEGKVVA